MNRQIVYAGALPRSFDFHQFEQSAGIAIGYLAQAIMGSSSWCAGLACGPTSPASMVVNVGPGALAQMTVVEENPFGTNINADTTDPLVKIGINIASTAMSALTAPATSGQSQVWLLEGQMLEQDGTPVVLPYVNPTTPSQPFSGPNNGGATQDTQRLQTVSLQWVAGAPATTGTQTAPGVTSGWVPLYLVTLANGATTITTGNIAVHPAAPFPAFTLPQLTPGFSRRQVLTGSGSFIVPLGVTLLKVRIIGGGGGGGGTANASTIASTGGGGGSDETIMTVTPGQSISYALGAGGSGGSNAGTNGTAGGTTTFGSLTATGGGGGTGVTSGIATTSGAAGAGSGGYDSQSGQVGGTGYNGGSAFVNGGGGGNAYYSGPGQSSSNSSTAQPGGSGQYPGTAGGGGISGGNGGSGHAGRIEVWC